MKIYIRANQDNNSNYDYINSLSYNAKRMLAQKTVSPDILDALSLCDEAYVRMDVAENLNTPEDVLETLAFDPTQSVRCIVAENPNINSDTIDALADSGDNNVLYRLAKRSDINEHVIKAIKESGDYWSIEKLLKNPATPNNVILEFLNSPKSRASTVYQIDISKLDKDIIDKLCHDENPDIRRNLARNATTPYEILLALSNDSDEYVADTLVTRPWTSEQIIRNVYRNHSDCEFILNAILRNAVTPPDLVSKIFESLENMDGISVFTLKHVAMNKNTSPEILRKLASSTRSEIRISVARNPNTPIDVLLKYATHDRSAKVVNNARKNKVYKEYMKSHQI